MYDFDVLRFLINCIEFLDILDSLPMVLCPAGSCAATQTKSLSTFQRRYSHD